MFGTYEDAYMSGAFRVEIANDEQEDGTFLAKFVTPSGQVVEASSTSRADAHNQVAEKIRLGVMDQSIQLAQ